MEYVTVKLGLFIYPSHLNSVQLGFKNVKFYFENMQSKLKVV